MIDKKDLLRIRVLAGLLESEILPPDEADDMRDREWDEIRAREKHIEALIGAVFARCGLEVEYDIDKRGKRVLTGVYYDDSDRSAQVTLDDEASLSALTKLMGSGLAADFKISVSGHSLVVSFTVAHGLENAEVI